MSEDRKLCPLSMSGPEEVPILKCQEDSCGWWDEDTKTCAVLTLARSMRKVTKNGR